MSRIEPIRASDIPDDLQPLLGLADGLMGFMPNDLFIMARNPQLLKAMGGLVQAVYGQGSLDPGFKRVIGYIASTAAGCRYCQSHTAHGAHRAGIDEKKIEAAWDYETSELFSEAERAALRVAQSAGVSPNAVTDEQFENLKIYFSADGIVEIVAVISMFGFLNRWNATFATEIEDKPGAFLKGLQR